MDSRLSFVTLVVRDIEASSEFYLRGLGWSSEFEGAGEVIMIRVGEKLILSLWQQEAAIAELGPIGRPTGALPFTLAHNVASEAEVDRVLEQARSAGATIIGAPVRREWGGYSGYFADPDGFRWEIAYNPFPIGQSLL